MKTIELDSDNNIVIFNGSFSFLEEEYAAAQDIARQLNLYKGENPFNTDQGLDWDNDILGKMGGIDYIKSQIRNRILENNEVVNIISTNVLRDEDILRIDTKINTIYGTVEI